MIVGAGDIASILNDREGVLFFASGVSDSQCVDVDKFHRERYLLLDQPKDNCLFYFSTISIYLKSTPYTQHKGKMEQLIRSNWNNYNIIRLGNISWGSNPNTFLNYLRNRKESNLPYELIDEWKYMIDEEQLLTLTDNLPLHGQNEINVFGRMAKPKELL